jgi:hypothetical protein
LKGFSERKAIKFEKKKKEVKVVWDKKKKESEKCLKNGSNDDEESFYFITKTFCLVSCLQLFFRYMKGMC